MSIESHSFEEGVDMFSLNCDALVNPVNCEGVMGAGLAAKFKSKFPASFLEYKEWCSTKSPKPGDVLRTFEFDSTIYHTATKGFWKNPSRIEYIISALDNLHEFISADFKKYGTLKVAIPKLGCGLGGLSYDRVRPLIVSMIDRFGFNKEISAESVKSKLTIYYPQ
jgi:O-acetyl-ADP-ribose deacetylase (regulator of RNase III)